MVILCAEERLTLSIAILPYFKNLIFDLSSDRNDAQVLSRARSPAVSFSRPIAGDRMVREGTVQEEYRAGTASNFIFTIDIQIIFPP